MTVSWKRSIRIENGKFGGTFRNEFLLDTNIVSAHLRRPSGLAHRFFQYSGRLYTSSVALAELFVWAYNRPIRRRF